MKAIVATAPGGPEVFRVAERPIPEPKAGWVLIRVKAFGLNRSEMFTRQGHSPGVLFPRVLGIECVGVVEAAPGGEVPVGQTVAAVMGGMGRAYDGGYAEYTLVPASQVLPVQTSLPWEVLGAIPETFLTAWGSLFEALAVEPGQTLLVRGGSSALGLATTTLAKAHGLTVVLTTRSQDKRQRLLDHGADQVLIDPGELAAAVRRQWPDGVDAVLELVGTVTLLDSLRLLRPRGTLCYSGILGNAWALKEFEPFMIPSTVRLTTYTSETLNARNATAALQSILDGVDAGRYRVAIDRVFGLEELVEAHRYMESNQAAGKLVVVT
ncbi:MAG TPA: zinc-binding alcohol dehydrogenase family protein [Roseiflexaceae bacterium]|nr:zinc-binding alcohol dehydrogenase family protein [Roseiflexaceae bacterium]